MEPYTQEQRAEIARLMSEGRSYFEAVMKMLGMTDVKVCINGKSVPLDGIGFYMGQLILDKSETLQDLLKSRGKMGDMCFMLAIKMLLRQRRIKIKRPPQPNRRKKKKTRRK